MGLFDDLIGIAKELNSVKQEVTDTFQQVASEAIGLKTEATDAVNKITQGATENITEIKQQISDSLPNIPGIGSDKK